MYNNNHSYFKCIRLVYFSSLNASHFVQGERRLLGSLTKTNFPSVVVAFEPDAPRCGSWHRQDDMLVGGLGHKADLRARTAPSTWQS